MAKHQDIIHKIWRRYFYPYYANRLVSKELRRYEQLLPSIKKRISRKEKINVVFFVMTPGMWKCDGLFKLMLKSEKFNPVAISHVYANDPEAYQITQQTALREYFESKGFPYIDGYSLTTHQYIDIKALDPDIVFYTQPYNVGCREFSIHALWDQCLFAYVPYYLGISNNYFLHNTLLQNIAWLMFYPTDYHYKMEKKLCVSKGKNIRVVGYPMADRFLERHPVMNSWKIKNPQLKRVIWAPHHSILEDDPLHHSNFLDMAEEMLNLAEEYANEVQFAFKPHPVLKNKLYGISDWGIKRTDEYYSRWEKLANGILADGDYVDLFLSSNAMIHDCGSFMAEYLYTCKPVLFVSKADGKIDLNDFGKQCFDLHYKANDIHDVKHFIDHVVIKGQDNLSQSRQNFFETTLKVNKETTVADQIFNILCQELAELQ